MKELIIEKLSNSKVVSRKQKNSYKLKQHAFIKCYNEEWKLVLVTIIGLVTFPRQISGLGVLYW